MDSRLLSPTLQDRTPSAAGPKPWRLSSQLWVAFLGSSLAYSIIAWINGRRLGCPPRVMRATAVLCTLVTLGDLTLRLAMSHHMLPEVIQDRHFRFGGRLLAMLLYVMVRHLQRPADRVYDMGGQDDYASLWLPGIGAIGAAALVIGSIVFVGKP